MNLCFFSGIILEDLSFKFIVDENISFRGCKHSSICLFNIMLENGTIVKLKAYDEFADFCYRFLNKGIKIAVYGRLCDRFECEIEYLMYYKN